MLLSIRTLDSDFRNIKPEIADELGFLFEFDTVMLLATKTEESNIIPFIFPVLMLSVKVEFSICNDEDSTLINSVLPLFLIKVEFLIINGVSIQP